MKVNRTFSIDLWIVKALQDKRNQSQFICDAIKTKLDGADDRNIEECSQRTLMIYLKNHPDTDSFLKRVLEQVLGRN